jgi:glucosyl-3-phosphoglycerate synthase
MTVGTDELSRAKAAAGERVLVCIPARNEAETIGPIVATIRDELMAAGEGRIPLVDDLLVVDDGSSDATAELAAAAGATVIRTPDDGAHGKGEAMAFGAAEVLRRARAADPTLDPASALIVFLDGDVLSFESRFVVGLVGPLIGDPQVSLVKGRYRRPLGAEPHGGGRVTELTAKPALALLFPELAWINQPLAGETALRASVLDKVELAAGYGVEIALLIDVLRLCGSHAIAEADLGVRRHRNRSLAELGPQAHTVLATILERARDW